MYRLPRNRMTAWNCLDRRYTVCKHYFCLVHCNGDSDSWQFLLIFQWSRVRITNAHAFETATCHLSMGGWEHRDQCDIQECHWASQLQWSWLYCKTLDVKEEVGLRKMEKDRHNIIDSIGFDHGCDGQRNYNSFTIFLVTIYWQAAILNL